MHFDPFHPFTDMSLNLTIRIEIVNYLLQRNMKTHARTHFYSTFIEIAHKQWASAQANRERIPDLLEKLSELEGDDAVYFQFTNIEPVQSEIDSCSCVVIVLCALAVEGYIYDYAARNLSDNFADDIDKLDAISKWLVVPQLVTGKKFPKDGKAYQLLKQLVSDRNYLAHPKSAPILSFNEKSKDWEISRKAQRMKEFSMSLFDKAQNAINALDELTLVIENLDPNEYASFYLVTMVGKRKAQTDTYGA